jgi:hypothetical protein
LIGRAIIQQLNGAPQLEAPHKESDGHVALKEFIQSGSRLHADRQALRFGRSV